MIELLVVLVIIGIVSAISIPALKGIGQSNTMASATRQLLDDLSFARHKAMTGRTTVHVLFVPELGEAPGSLSPGDTIVYNRLRETGPYRSYAVYAERTPGDQPGRPTRRYVTKWRSLPEGIFIAPWQFGHRNWPAPDDLRDHLFEAVRLPFPSVNGTQEVDLPHVAFDQQGRLVRGLGSFLRFWKDEFIWVTKGSVMAVYDPAGNLEINVRESPRDNWMINTNRIRIDAVTGRGKLERPEIQ